MKNKNQSKPGKAILYLLIALLTTSTLTFTACDKEEVVPSPAPVEESPISGPISAPDSDEAALDSTSSPVEEAAPVDSTSSPKNDAGTTPPPIDEKISLPDENTVNPINDKPLLPDENTPPPADQGNETSSPTSPADPKPVTKPEPPATATPTAPVPTPVKPEPKPSVPTPAPTTPAPAKTTYTISRDQTIVDGDELNLAPGTLVKLESGTRGPLLLKNFKGTKGAPIVFINSGGTTTIQSSGSYGLKTQNCKYFRITGSGSGSGKGIVVDGGHIGMSLEYLSSDFDIDQVEVKNSGFAGIMAKTDPSCDTKTQRGNFLMQNLRFFNNYIHDVTGEGFYIGNSFGEAGRPSDCGQVYPHDIINVEVFNNTIKNSGCEGIQAGCVTTGLKIHNNHISKFGISPFANAQDNGIQVGEGSTGLVYKNIIQDGPGNGIIVLGKGNTIVSNNLVVNPGSYGAFIDNRGSASGEIAFVNNTIISPGSGGIKTYNELVKNKFCNNIITGTTEFFIYGSSATGEELNNLTKASISECGFINPSGGNYKLQNSSPAVDAGINYGVINDLENNSRPRGQACDIGAYEL